MGKGFFNEYGNKITFFDDKDMNKKLSVINHSVSVGYTGMERERYYILNHIPLLLENNLMDFPVNIECIDTGGIPNMPDFRITDSKIDYVLETTMATTEEFIRQKNEFDRANIQWSYNIWKENNLPRIVLFPKEEIDYGKPIFGKASEDICGILTSDDIIKKTKKLPKYDIEKELETQLLIYYNFPVNGKLEIDHSLRFIFHYLDAKNYRDLPTKFDKIHFMRDNLTVYDILGNDWKILYNKKYYDF